MQSLLALALLLVACAQALLVPARVPAAVSRTCSTSSRVLMCDGEAAAPEPAAAAPAEASADEGAQQRRRQREPRTPLEELTVGSTVEGTVRSVQSYGAFVNVGSTTDGLLHISEMSDGFVEDAASMFKVGDKVSVRIKSVNLEKNQLALSCKSEDAASPPRRGGGKGRPDLSEFENADPKEFITGTVNSITSYGAFITLKEGVDGLVHISSIAEERLEKVEDKLTEGQEVQVRIVSFEKEKRRLGLSMLPFVEGEEEAKQEGGRRRGGGGRRGGGFDGDDDSAFKLSSEEVEKLTLDFEADGDEVSVFAQALKRAELVKEKKSKKEKYSPVQL